MIYLDEARMLQHHHQKFSHLSGAETIAPFLVCYRNTYNHCCRFDKYAETAKMCRVINLYEKYKICESRRFILLIKVFSVVIVLEEILL